LCKKRRIDQWVFRIRHEQKHSISSHFVTLTYAPEYLPKTPRNLGTLKKAELQTFFRRLREYEKQSGNTRIIKYFGAGEYGSETKRPHYHIVLLNVLDAKNIYKAWSKKRQLKGNIDIGTITRDSIAYCIKYIDKFCHIGYAKSDQRERQFQLFSKGIGSKYLTAQQKLYHRNNPLKNFVQSVDGHKIGMPRYYAKSIWDTEELKESRRKILVNHLEEKEKQNRIKYELKYNHCYDQYLNLKIKKEKRNFKLLQINKRNKI